MQSPCLRCRPFAGVLVREFKHLAVDMYIIEEEGAKKLQVEAHFGKRKALASIRTVCSHITVGPRSCHSAVADNEHSLRDVWSCKSMCLWLRCIDSSISSTKEQVRLHDRCYECLRHAARHQSAAALRLSIFFCAIELQMASHASRSRRAICPVLL